MGRRVGGRQDADCRRKLTGHRLDARQRRRQMKMLYTSLLLLDYSSHSLHLCSTLLLPRPVFLFAPSVSLRPITAKSSKDARSLSVSSRGSARCRHTTSERSVAIWGRFLTIRGLFSARPPSKCALMGIKELATQSYQKLSCKAPRSKGRCQKQHRLSHEEGTGRVSVFSAFHRTLTSEHWMLESRSVHSLQTPRSQLCLLAQSDSERFVAMLRCKSL